MNTQPRDDPRYKTGKWNRTSRAVLIRDGYECRIEPGCPTRAKVADHIIPVSSGLSDFEFFAMSNLRAGCLLHNVARGMNEKAMQTSTTKGNRLVNRAHGLHSKRINASNSGRFLKRAVDGRSKPTVKLSPEAEIDRIQLVTGDYSVKTSA